MAGPQLGPKYDLAVRLGRIEAQLRAMQTQPVGQALSSFQSDGSLGLSVYLDQVTGVTETVWYQGPNTPGATQTNGQWPPFMVIGQLMAGGTSIGNGAITYRPDGSESMTIGNKGVGLLDKYSNVIWSESETAFGGIKTPQMNAGPMVNTNTGTWPSTAATAWTTIATATVFANQPLLYFSGQSYAPAGVTGQFRMTVNGTQVGTTWSASGGNFTSFGQQPTLPAAVSFGQAVVVNLDAYVSAGSGTILAQCYGLAGTATS